MERSSFESKANLLKLGLLLCLLNVTSCGLSGTYLGFKAWHHEWSDCTKVDLYLRIAIYFGLILDIFLGYLVIRRIISRWKYGLLVVYCTASWFIAHQAHWATDAPPACTKALRR